MNHGRKLHIGIIGAGAIVKERHLPALLKMSDVEVTAVCNSTFESSQAFCQEHLPHATPMKNWADLLAIPELDVVWIGTPPYLHSAITVSALEAKKHVFCQARMAMNLHEAQEMQSAARKHPHLVTMLCPPPHGMRGDKVMRTVLAEHFIGTPHQVRLRSLGSQWLNPDAPAHWRQRAELSGLNVLTLGIYVEVLQRWLGPITSVTAHAKTLFPIRKGYEVRIPDMLTVLCSFAHGVQGVLEFSGVHAFAPTERLEIYGNLGKLSYDFTTDRIEAGRVGDRQMHELAIEQPIPWQVEEQFIAAVKAPDKPRPHPTFEDGVAYMRVIQAVHEALESGQWVKVERS